MSVSVFCRVIFWGNDKTATFASSSVDSFYDINELLLVLNGPVDFVVVTCSQVNHYVLVSVKEHYCAGVVQFVHLVEVGYLKREIHVNVENLIYIMLVSKHRSLEIAEM